MDFKEININDKAKFESFIYNKNYMTCEFAFVNLYCLRKKYGTQIFIDDFLYLRQTTKSLPNAFYYFIPQGDGDIKKAIERTEADALSHGKDFMLWGVTEQQREMIESIFPNRYEFTTHRDWAEYIYLSERLITLEGSDLKKRRNNLNLFLNKYGDRYQFTPLVKENLCQAFDYQKQWLAENAENNEDAKSLYQENEIIEDAFENWEALGLKGGLVKIDDTVVGYTYGSQTYSNTFDILVEKADHTKNGIYQAINRDFAKFACADVTYINREEDLGIEGLRVSKTAYRPEILLAKYEARLK
jgi:hypothetical protein